MKKHKTKEEWIYWIKQYEDNTWSNKLKNDFNNLNYSDKFKIFTDKEYLIDENNKEKNIYLLERFLMESLNVIKFSTSGFAVKKKVK